MKSNLLILLTRGLRSDAISDERYWPLRTPNLERLAHRGLRLVARSACPCVNGGLVSVLTGLHPRQHGQLGDEQPLGSGHATIGDWLAGAGYFLAGAGCLGPLVPVMDRVVPVEDVAIVEPSDQCAYWRSLRGRKLIVALAEQRRQRLRVGPFDPDRVLLDADSDIDGFISSAALDLVDYLPTDKPWALIVSFSGPANDLPPPTLYQTLVNERRLNRGFQPPDFTTLDALAEPAYPRAMLQRLDPPTLARIRCDYLARVALVDHGIGRLASAISMRPDAGRNWVAVCSDRGHLLGEHGLLGHGSFLAPAIKVPLILTPPMPKAGGDRKAASAALVSTVDFPATLGALAGCDVPSEVSGRSLLPLLYDDPIVDTHPGGILSEFHDRLMLETDRYKVIFHRTTRRCLGLYDMLVDPQERKNLLDAPGGRNVLDSLRWRLADALMPLRAAPVSTRHIPV